MLSIKQIINNLDKTDDYNYDKLININGWVRTVRSSSNILGFCFTEIGRH